MLADRLEVLASLMLSKWPALVAGFNRPSTHLKVLWRMEFIIPGAHGFNYEYWLSPPLPSGEVDIYKKCFIKLLPSVCPLIK